MCEEATYSHHLKTRLGTPVWFPNGQKCPKVRWSDFQWCVPKMAQPFKRQPYSLNHLKTRHKLCPVYHHSPVFECSLYLVMNYPGMNCSGALTWLCPCPGDEGPPKLQGSLLFWNLLVTAIAEKAESGWLPRPEPFWGTGFQGSLAETNFSNWNSCIENWNNCFTVKTTVKESANLDESRYRIVQFA